MLFAMSVQWALHSEQAEHTFDCQTHLVTQGCSFFQHQSLQTGEATADPAFAYGGSASLPGVSPVLGSSTRGIGIKRLSSSPPAALALRVAGLCFTSSSGMSR